MRRETLLPAGLLLVLFFLGNGQLLVTDPVECNYVLTAREMLEAGDWLSPRIFGNYWYDKPIFFYWELMAAFKLFGVNEFAARFFPVVFAMANLVLAWWFAKRFYGEKNALLTVMILGTSFEFWYLGKAIITDMAFIFFFNATLIAFYVGFTEKRRSLYLIGYVMAGFAVLTKGPIGLLLPGLIMVLFLVGRRHYKELLHLNWFLGLPLFILVAGSWYWPMYQLHGREFIDGFLGVHNVLRATVSEHPHANVWYYYMMIFLLGFCPWSFIVLFHIKKHWSELKQDKLAEHTIFLLIWALTVNVFFQLMATKYTTYTLPAMLPLGILFGRLLAERQSFVRKAALATGGILAVLTFLLAMPLCRRYSGHDAAALLQQLPEQGAVYSYGSYYTSEAFYFHEKIAALERAARISQMLPDGISWNAKNVMPFQAMEELPRNTVFYVLCDTEDEQRFKRELPENEPETVATAGNRLILRCYLPE